MKEKKQKENIDPISNNKEIIKIKERKNNFGTIARKWLTKTPLTILLIAIIIAAYALLNWGVDKADLKDIDLSKDKLNVLSEQSKDIVGKIDKDINMLLVNIKATLPNINEFAYQYQKENKKIKVEELNDVTTRPDLVSKYNLTSNSCLMIITCGDKEEILVTNDFYTWDYTTTNQKNVAEEAITNALIAVSTDKNPKIYYLTGHNAGSMEYFYYLADSLQKEANEFEELNLLTKGKVPEDCATLMITTLAEDLTKTESDAIIKYIKKGGELIIFSDPNVNKINLKNYQKVLDQYGVSVSNGVILEGDENKRLLISPSFVLSNINPTTSITKKANMNMNVCFMNAGKIEFKDNEHLEKLGVMVENLATASSQAFHRTDMTISDVKKTKKDEDAGNAVLGALLTKKINDNTSSNLIIYPNSIFIANTPVNTQDYRYAIDYYNNEDIALNSIAYLTGRDDIITIRKDTDAAVYEVTQEQHKIIVVIIFTVPVLILLAGIIIWQVRRRKK